MRCDGPFGSAIKSEHYVDDGVRVVRLQNIGSSTYRSGDAAFLDPAYVEREIGDGHWVVCGDVLVAGLGDENNPLGRACVAPPGLGPTIVKADCYRFRLDSRQVDAHFAALQLSALAYAECGFLATGSTRQRLNLGLASARYLALPESLDEQRAIVRWLDRATARIDALIEKKTRFIELLREKRQALITQAVTRGLDPNVPMKDSGVVWLGPVPAHWQVRPMKYIAQIQTGVAKGKDTTDRETIEVPYLRVANVQDGHIDLSDVATIAIPVEDLPRYRLQPGDVLMNEGGDFDKLGRGHVWSGEIDPCIHQNHVFAVRPTQVTSEWLNAYTSSSAAQFYFMAHSKQSTNLASISSSNLMELPVPIPPTAEQKRTLLDLSDRLRRLEAVSERTNRSVDLLRERRAALITAAVTGQIDIREAA
jgi:type I restriction enzyme S subunit